MHILLYERSAYNQYDLTYALKNEGITISTFTHIFQNKNKDDAFYLNFTKELKDYHYDAVFSVNYYPLIAMVCYEQNTKYISWSYDCPLDVRNIEDTLWYPTNYVFLFDRMQVQGYLDKGFDHIFHLPLAVNTQRLSGITPTASEYKKYGSDISFVGSLYPSVYEQLIEPLPDYLRGYLDALCESQLMIYGYFFVNEMISPEILQNITDVYTRLYPEANFHIIKEELSYTMATQVTNLERIHLLKQVSTIEGSSIKLFSKDSYEILNTVEHCGPIDYMTQMPLVFKCSKINLNITLKCLQSGIPLRALDIIGCGGFLLSNYQLELNEYFENGKEFVSYGSLEEAKELAEYYLAHEKERIEIAKKGYQKVKEQFTYEKQLKTIFKISCLI